MRQLKFVWNCYFIKREFYYYAKEKEKTMSLEYLGKISLLAKKQLTNIFRSCRKDIKLNVVLKTSNRLRNAFRFKYQLPKCINSKVL